MTVTLEQFFAVDPTAARFEQFHHENPLVYRTLVRLVEGWLSLHGYRQLGIRMLWEHARWEIIHITSDPDYKLNDHYTSYYVRLLIDQHPRYAELFELRASPADIWIALREDE